MNYESSVQVSFWYGNSLEAYRSDRVENFTLQPDRQWHDRQPVWLLGHLTVEPVGEGGGDGGGASTGLLVAGGAAAVLVVGGVIFWMVRRKNAGDVE